MRPCGPVRSVNEEEFWRGRMRWLLFTSRGFTFRVDSTGSAKPSVGFALSGLSVSFP